MTERNPMMDVQTSEQCDQLFTALSAFQGEVQPPKKTATNPHFKSKFADLAEVLDAVRGPMAKHGLSLTQMPVGTCDGVVRVVTLVGHKSGQWLKGILDMPLAQKTPQGVGSTVSYARRYCAMAALGIAAEDDDGEAAEGRGGPRQSNGSGQASSAPKSDAVGLGKAVMETLHRELSAQSDIDALAQFHNHALSQMDKANVDEGPRQTFWAAWGKRCEALKLNPGKVAAAARARTAA